MERNGFKIKNWGVKDNLIIYLSEPLNTWKK